MQDQRNCIAATEGAPRLAMSLYAGRTSVTTVSPRAGLSTPVQFGAHEQGADAPARPTALARYLRRQPCLSTPRHCWGAGQTAGHCHARWALPPNRMPSTACPKGRPIRGLAAGAAHAALTVDGVAVSTVGSRGLLARSVLSKKTSIAGVAVVTCLVPSTEVPVPNGWRDRPRPPEGSTPRACRVIHHRSDLPGPCQPHPRDDGWALLQAHRRSRTPWRHLMPRTVPASP